MPPGVWLATIADPSGFFEACDWFGCDCLSDWMLPDVTCWAFFWLELVASVGKCAFLAESCFLLQCVFLVRSFDWSVDCLLLLSSIDPFRAAVDFCDVVVTEVNAELAKEVFDAVSTEFPNEYCNAVRDSGLI